MEKASVILKEGHQNLLEELQQHNTAVFILLGDSGNILEEGGHQTRVLSSKYQSSVHSWILMKMSSQRM